MIIVKVQFDAAERAVSDVGGMCCGSGAVLDDSGGDLETSRINKDAGMPTTHTILVQSRCTCNV